MSRNHYKMMVQFRNFIWSYCKICYNNKTSRLCLYLFGLVEALKKIWHSCKIWCNINNLEHVETCLDLQKMVKFQNFYFVLIQRMVQYKSISLYLSLSLSIYSRWNGISDFSNSIGIIKWSINQALSNLT